VWPFILSICCLLLMAVVDPCLIISMPVMTAVINECYYLPTL